MADNGGQVAYHEYCYRWTCERCKTENRSAELIAGESNQCSGCENVVRIATVKYDNGAVARVG